MMLKALLVDDEINILRNLQQVIPWEDIGIEIVGLADNGVKALELAGIHHIDLVLSDISMPIMDGIAFVQKLRERNHSCECIMLSGYQSLDYARSLMYYGVKEYLLKPIHYEELERVVRQVAASIRAKRLKDMEEEKALGNVVNLVYEKMLYDYLMDYTAVATHPLPTIDETHVEDMEFLLLLVDLEHYSRLSLGWNEKEQKLWNFAVYNVLREVLISENLKYTVLQMRPGEWCVLIGNVRETSLPVDNNQAHNWADLIRDGVRKNVKLEVNIGMYTQWLSATELATAYKCVKREVNLSQGSETVVASIAKTNGTVNVQNAYLWQLTEAIVTALKQRNRLHTEEAIQALNEHLKAIPDSRMLRVQQVLHFMVLNLLREMREINMFKQLEEENILTKLSCSVNAKDVLVVLNEMVSQFLAVFVSDKSCAAMMKSTETYIHERLSKDLGIDELASRLGISNSYFSLLFKQHFGVTFIEYLTNLRIETAKSLLEEKERRVAQISESVGYLDGRYFLKLFHKYTGMTPSEWRTSRKKMACGTK